ncbi:MAG: SDR family oxidoreductase [Piscinibacter sp.]|uniref:SDR family oxidoreductase n=1 Tax=Piscinibacter sp. TaxID=1903157 RepID=UPI00258F7BE4|nr:SDR family oxidoreductase [Piscinibacter sp.]MCW5664685.1 SDR family oxidoreductase [Piscinibacter sp.]
MNIVILGGTGLIGTRLAALLRRAGHQVAAVSPSTGVDSVTGRGLDAALAGAQVVVDVTNSPSFAPEDVLAFFQASTRHLLAAARAAGVQHLVALSVVGAERLPDSGYLRAKLAQEALIARGGVPFTVLRATQFIEFLGAIADSLTDAGVVHAPAAPLQPVAADDVAATLAEVALAAPLNGRLELGGPQRAPLDALLRRWLPARGDRRSVVTDPTATYFGARLEGDALCTAADARLGRTGLDDWLARAPLAA